MKRVKLVIIVTKILLYKNLIIIYIQPVNHVLLGELLVYTFPIDYLFHLQFQNSNKKQKIHMLQG